MSSAQAQNIPRFTAAVRARGEMSSCLHGKAALLDLDVITKKRQRKRQAIVESERTVTNLIEEITVKFSKQGKLKVKPAAI